MVLENSFYQIKFDSGNILSLKYFKCARHNSGYSMKTMTCKQLGGACEKQFRAETFDEIAEMSKQHGMEMFQKGDPAHLEAISTMMKLMQDPAAMKEWFDGKKKEFEALSED